MGDSAGGDTSTTEGSGEDGIVALTPPSGGGAGATPLFFVQGAGRGTDLFAELARLLGADQPFYELRTTGLAPQSADNADASEREFGFSSVESLAARFAAAMCRLQPEGEFELGGWSFGGCVATEVARQLRSVHRRTVRRLVLVDWVEQSMAEADYDTQISAVGALVRSVELMTGKTMPDVDMAAFGSLALEAKIDRALQLMVQHGMLPARAAEAGSAQHTELGGVVRSFEHSIRSLLAHRMPPIEQIVTDAAAEGTRVVAVRADRFGFPGMHPFDWDAAASGANGCIELHTIDCDHWAILRAPHVQELAQHISAALKE